MFSSSTSFPTTIMKLFLLAVASTFALSSARVTRPWVDGYNASIADSNISTAGDHDVTTAAVCNIPIPPASDEVWDACRCRGENFWDAMHSSSEGAGKLFRSIRDTSESPFTNIADLTKWGWKDATVRPIYFDFAKAWGVDHVLRAIGVSDKATKDGGRIEVVRVTHGDGDANGGGWGTSPYNNQPQYTVDGKNYRVTGSEYNFGFDPSGGILLALDRMSPQFAGSKRYPKVEGSDLPDLQAFSDVAWLKWKETTGSAPTSIRYFMSLSITNHDTRGILNIILTGEEYCEVPAWPGHDVDPTSEEGAALLGT
jgi:hypothetical protein